MKTTSMKFLAVACALGACSPAGSTGAGPNEPPPASAEAPPEPVQEIPATVTGDEPDIREQVETALKTFKVEGIPIYAQVSEDFPDEFAVFVDATVAAIRSDNTERDAGLAGKNFTVGLKDKYADRMKDAGPEKVRALMTSRRDLFVAVQDVYGAEACNEMARADRFADDTLARVGAAFTPYMIASWSAMKAGIATPKPQAKPTRQDILALAAAAVRAGGPKTEIEAWANDNTLADGHQCAMLIALISAELTMPGEAGDRLLAGSTVSLPYAGP